MCISRKRKGCVFKMEKTIIPANVEKLEDVLRFVNEQIDKAGCPAPSRGQIELAVEEIFVNIASYAYPSGGGEVQIECGVSGEDNCLTIRFSDKGRAFDPLAKEDADTSPQALLAREGGLGILLVKKLMDEVSYSRRFGRNELTVKKRLGGSRA